MFILKFIKKIRCFFDIFLKKIKPIIIRNSRVPNWFSNKDMEMYGITLFPFIFVINFDNRQNELIYKKYEILNHEKIHFQQMLETGIIGFYLIFLLEFMYKSIKYKNIVQGYLNISFEIESYKNMKNLQYLDYRKRYNWLKYIIN
tara:strand:+ start:1194 stop:1628 length:435 start_codon:yes stop_codon:yes gene_type:complete